MQDDKLEVKKQRLADEKFGRNVKVYKDMHDKLKDLSEEVGLPMSELLDVMLEWTFKRIEIVD